MSASMAASFGKCSFILQNILDLFYDGFDTVGVLGNSMFIFLQICAGEHFFHAGEKGIVGDIRNDAVPVT